jgi:hypothetical protein
MVGTKEQWLAENTWYEQVVGPRVSFTNNVRKLFGNIKSAIVALDQIAADSMTLGQASDEDLVLLHDRLSVVLIDKIDSLI